MSSQAHAAALPEPLVPCDLTPGTRVLRDVKLADATPKAEISVFADDVWHLHPMALNPAGRRIAINFTDSPQPYQQTLKRLVWTLINRRTPVEMLQRPAAMRGRSAAESIYETFTVGMKPFVIWLDRRGIKRLCDVDDDVLWDYANHVATQPCLRDRKARRLSGVTRIWLLAPYLPAADRLGQPPWEPHGFEDLLGPANSSTENKTRPIHPQTMSGLLVGALRFVQDFSDDILQAAQERDAMTAKAHRRRMEPGDNAKLDKYLDGLRRDGQALPGLINTSGRLVLARHYLAAKLDVSYDVLQKARSSGIPIQAGAPLDTPINGRVHGKPWTSAIDFYEVNHLVRLLTGACLVVVAYLSGMRRQECLALRRGCCRPAADGDAAGGFEIVGRTFKTALDPQGNAIPGGAVRADPWHVIEPAAAAVSIMERLHPHELLFARAAFNPTKSGDRAPSIQTTNFTFEQLIAWCNDTAVKINQPDEAIPEDPEGAITMMRFRRTLAWFIYRLPGGRISLGIQYGHLEPFVTDGYGLRGSVGLGGVFPMEEALARSERLSDAADRLDAGEAVSGPAASQYIEGVAEFANRYPGRVLPQKAYKQLLTNPRLQIHDNGLQPVACCYDATRALCHPDNQRSLDIKRSPNLTRCDPRCGNVARTDSHIDEISVEIDHLGKQQALPMTPEPMRLAHGQRISMLQDIIDTHERSRIRPEPPPSEETQ